jgi:hypothetical protein
MQQACKEKTTGFDKAAGSPGHLGRESERRRDNNIDTILAAESDNGRQR